MPLTPLADRLDVEQRLGRTLVEPDEAARVETILRDVSAAIRHEARQQISLGESTIHVTPSNGRLLLPQHPIVSIESVEDISSAAVTYTWYAGWPSLVVDSSLLLNSWEIAPFSYASPARPITVIYTHGYDPVPDEIIGIAANMALRTFGLLPTDTGVSSESLGAYSVTYGSAAAAGGFGMLPDERAIVRSYRRPRQPISML